MALHGSTTRQQDVTVRDARAIIEWRCTPLDDGPGICLMKGNGHLLVASSNPQPGHVQCSARHIGCDPEPRRVAIPCEARLDHIEVAAEIHQALQQAQSAIRIGQRRAVHPLAQRGRVRGTPGQGELSILHRA